MSKFISIEEAVSKVKDGMTIMVGGFLANGTPNKIVDALAKSGVKNLTLICNDTAYPDKGVGQLIANKQVKKLFVSHIGTNPHTSEQMNSGELEIEFCPQGSLAERVRAGGCGLGGILTQTGMGTIVAEGKQIVNVDGKTVESRYRIGWCQPWRQSRKSGLPGNISKFQPVNGFCR